ncbi:MAG: hypothetical protein EZS28_042329, partial [Streblomastix strix]
EIKQVHQTIERLGIQIQITHLPGVKNEIADTLNDNGDDDQSEHATEPKLFINENDGLKKNDSGTRLQATVNGEANLEINISVTSANTPFHNVNGSDGLEGNSCETQLLVSTNENGHLNYQAIDNTDNINNNEQANDNRTGGNINKQKFCNENQYEQGTKHQDNGYAELKGTVSLHATNTQQELGNSNISQPKHQPTLIIISPELGQVIGKVVEPIQMMQLKNDHDTRSKHACQTPYSINPQEFPKLERTPTLITTSHLR